MATVSKKLTAILLTAAMILTGSLGSCISVFADGGENPDNLMNQSSENSYVCRDSEGMTNNGITIEKAEFCKGKDKLTFGYKVIYGFVYLRLSGAPEGARYKITRSNAGYDHHNFWLVGMPPAHGFSWEFGYSPGETIDFDVYDNKGEEKLASFSNVELRVIDCNKAVDELEKGDGGEPALLTCDFFSGGPCGSTSAKNPGVNEFADGNVYIRVKNIPGAAKFDIEYNKLKKPAQNESPAEYEKTKSKHKGFIGTMPTASNNTDYFSVPMVVHNNSYMDTPDEQKNKPEFPITVYVYDKDDQLLHTFNDVYPRIVSKFNRLITAANGLTGGLEFGQLNLLVGDSYTVNHNEYTEDSAKAFLDARKEAEDLIKGKKGTQAQVNFLTLTLFNARKNLVPKGGSGTPIQEWEFDKDTNTLIKYNGSAKDVVIPEEFDGAPVFHIGEGAFLSKGISKISLPSKLKTVKKNAFKDNNIRELNIPATTSEIAEGAFNDNRISELTFAPVSSVTTIGKDAFRSNALKKVTIPGSIKSIKDYAFAFNMFESETFEIDAKASDVNFEPSALDKNTANKNQRVLPKFLKDDPAQPPQPAMPFKMLCLLESKDDVQNFSISVTNKATQQTYQPIKSEIDDDSILYTFDIPKGEYMFKENSKFFAICACGKPMAEDEKVFNYKGINSEPFSLIIKSWDNWREITYQLTSEMKLKPYNPADPACSLRAILEKGKSLLANQIPMFSMDENKYAFVGWRSENKTYTSEELMKYVPEKNMHFLAVIRNKQTNQEIVAGDTPTPNPPSGGSGGSGGSSGGSAAGGTASGSNGADGVNNSSKTETDTKKSDAVSFSDVSDSHWASAAVKYVAAKKIFNGTGDNKFSPSEKMTRGMFVTALARYFNGTGETPAAFRDVKSGDYYASSVGWALEKKIINGISAGEFGSGFEINREQVAAILYRAITSEGKAPKDKKAVSRTEFKDASSISPFAKEAVGELVAMGILTGRDGDLFAPKDRLTRAEAAAIFHRLDTVLK